MHCLPCMIETENTFYDPMLYVVLSYDYSGASVVFHRGPHKKYQLSMQEFSILTDTDKGAKYNEVVKELFSSVKTYVVSKSIYQKSKHRYTEHKIKNGSPTVKIEDPMKEHFPAEIHISSGGNLLKGLITIADKTNNQNIIVPLIL